MRNSVKSTENETNIEDEEDDSTVPQVPNISYNTFISGATTSEDSNQQAPYYEVIRSVDTLPASQVNAPNADDYEYVDIPTSMKRLS